MIVTASGQLTVAEVARHLRRETLRKSRFALYFMGLYILLALLLTAFAALSDPERLSNLLVNVWMFPAMIAAFWAVILLLLNPMARRQLQSSPELSAETTYEFSEDGIVCASSVSSGRLTWSALHGVRERKDAFLLERSNVVMNLIPKRMFSSSSEIDALRELMHAKMNSKAKLFKKPANGVGP